MTPQNYFTGILHLHSAWQERPEAIKAFQKIFFWWWCYIYIYIYIHLSLSVCKCDVCMHPRLTTDAGRLCGSHVARGILHVLVLVARSCLLRWYLRRRDLHKVCRWLGVVMLVDLVTMCLLDYRPVSVYEALSGHGVSPCLYVEVGAHMCQSCNPPPYLPLPMDFQANLATHAQSYCAHTCVNMCRYGWNGKRPLLIPPATC